MIFTVTPEVGWLRTSLISWWREAPDLRELCLRLAASGRAFAEAEFAADDMSLRPAESIPIRTYVRALATLPLAAPGRYVRARWRWMRLRVVQAR